MSGSYSNPEQVSAELLSPAALQVSPKVTSVCWLLVLQDWGNISYCEIFLIVALAMCEKLVFGS